MVRNRTRKTNIGLVSREHMKDAIDLILEGNKIRKVATLKNIPYTTLQRYYKKVAKSDAVQRFTPNYAVKKIFTDEQEQSLVDYLVTCSQMFYGLTPNEVRQVAYQMALTNDISVSQKWHDTQKAGLEWFYGFKKRHPVLSLRTPEGCSLSRATAFNRHNVKTFFDNLEIVMTRNESFGNGTRIFNLDETNTMTVQKSGKVLAVRGQKQVSKVTSGEKGTLVTTCYIINALGHALPPVMIFPRVHFKQHMITGAPTGTLGLANPSGWMNSSLFVKTMQHFIDQSQSSKENPSLLIMDNYEAHICIEAINLARENGVTILTVPPHSTGKLQPLDVAVFKPFKTAYNAAIDSWMMRNPGQTFSIYEVAQCIKEAHMKAMTPANICIAFQCTGIFPFNRDIFTDLDFAPSEVTNRDIVQPVTLSEDDIRTRTPSPSLLIDYDAASEHPIITQALTQAVTPALQSIPFLDPSIMGSTFERVETETPVNRGRAPVEVMLPEDEICRRTPSPSTSGLQSSNTQAITFLSPFDFRGIPKAGPRKNNRAPRRKGKSMIATDTPNKEEIETRQQEKANKQKRQRMQGAKNIKKKVLQTASSDEENNKIEKKRKQRQRIAKRKVSESESSEEDIGNMSTYSEEEGGYDDEDEMEIDPDNFRPLESSPKEGDFVLIQFVAHKTKVFYIGKIIGKRGGTDVDISFLRKSTKVRNGYRLPDVPDIASVPYGDVKMILPSPTFSGTKRQQQVYKFDLDFSRLNLR